MNYRDLINALMLMGEPDRAQINACMEGKHSMTRLAYELELLIESYQHRRLEGQQVTTKSELLQDDDFKECFETAISEQAAYIFEHCGMPLQATEALFRVLQDECNEHIEDGGVVR